MGNLLVPFKKFLSNKNTVTILGVLVGLVVLYFGYTWRINSAVKSVSVPFATTRLTSGQYINESDIGTTEIPQSVVNSMPNLVTKSADVKGKIVNYDSVIQENGFFYYSNGTGNIMEGTAMPNYIFQSLKDEETIYGLKVDFEKTYANSIMPEDYIDIYIYITKDDGDKIYGKFISSIQVLAVRDSSGKDVFADSSNLGTPSQILFAVDEESYLLLKKAELNGYSMTPVLRSSSYSTAGGDKKGEISTEIKNLILDGWVDNESLLN